MLMSVVSPESISLHLMINSGKFKKLGVTECQSR